MAKIYGQIIIEVELDGKSITGTQLELQGLASISEGHLRDVAVRQMPNRLRVLRAYTPTKDWQIGAQINLGAPFEKDTIT